MHLFERFQRRDPPPPAPVDHEALRFEMTQTDPEFAHVRDVHHEAQGLLGAHQTGQQILDRFNARLRDSWRPPA